LGGWIGLVKRGCGALASALVSECRRASRERGRCPRPIAFLSSYSCPSSGDSPAPATATGLQLQCRSSAPKHSHLLVSSGRLLLDHCLHHLMMTIVLVTLHTCTGAYSLLVRLPHSGLLPDLVRLLLPLPSNTRRRHQQLTLSNSNIDCFFLCVLPSSFVCSRVVAVAVMP
jgi:hypothetical protein